VPNNPDDSAITSAIIALVHNLGLEVIAEGVETAEQVQFLATQNCDMIQGYFLSHPVSAQKMQLQLNTLKEEVMI
jgi:EAL domain-containing protein (putative c-di-GMP-specific phosphodiesterase class I)